MCEGATGETEANRAQMLHRYPSEDLGDFKRKTSHDLDLEGLGRVG